MKRGGWGKSILHSTSAFCGSTPTLPRKREHIFLVAKAQSDLITLPGFKKVWAKALVFRIGTIAQNYFKYKMIDDKALPDALDVLSLSSRK